MAIAHVRPRFALDLLAKKTTFSPVVSIQGPRQCGKSFLARELLPSRLKNTLYFSLDKKEIRHFAEANPALFLRQGEKKTFIIDEVQKAPDLFDEIKADVDENRIPGKYILLGSTEFSLENQIRESLTGRLSRIQLYPLCLAEVQKLEINRVKIFPFVQAKSRVEKNAIIQFLENGGFPGMFAVRSANEREQLAQDWLALTVERDIHQFTKYKFDSDDALEILNAIAILENPNLANISKKVKVPARRVQSYLKILKMLFVIFEITPSKDSAGKSQFFLIDPILLGHFKASFEKKILTWIYLEMLCQLSYKAKKSNRISFYKTAKSSPVHLMYEEDNHIVFAKVCFEQNFDSRDLLIFDSIKKKYKDKKLKLYLFYGGRERFYVDEIQILPWESIV